MKKLLCDICLAEVNNYGHWYGGEKPRNMYEIKCIDSYDDSDTYDGIIICHKCIQKMIMNEESED